MLIVGRMSIGVCAGSRMTCLGVCAWRGRFVLSLGRGWRNRGMGAVRCLLDRQAVNQASKRPTIYAARHASLSRLLVWGSWTDIQSVPVDLAA